MDNQDAMMKLVKELFDYDSMGDFYVAKDTLVTGGKMGRVFTGILSKNEVIVDGS